MSINKTWAVAKTIGEALMLVVKQCVLNQSWDYLLLFDALVFARNPIWESILHSKWFLVGIGLFQAQGVGLGCFLLLLLFTFLQEPTTG